MNDATADKRKSGAAGIPLWIAWAALGGFGLGRHAYGAAASAPVAAPDEMTVALQEIPVWEVAAERVRSSFLRGQSTVVRKVEYAPTKYPNFNSDAPLYGHVGFENAAATRQSRNRNFALDSVQQGGDYDLLYFDDDGDGDLTNGKPRHLLKESERLVRRSSSLKEAYFEPIQVTFDFGSAGRQPLELLPHLRIYPGDEPQFSFVAARVHTGTFAIEGTTYQAFVGYRFSVGGPLDQPATTLILAPQGGEPVSWWGGNELFATHRLGGRLYRFSCTPAGDRLSVRPYTGPTGTLEVGAGGRKVEKLEMYGSLRAKETAVAIGGVPADGWPKATQRCEIPVGDYYPAYLTVAFGDIQVEVSNNYHINAQGQPRGNREAVAGITIRPDKPYVLDFSNKPVVVFTEPATTARVAPGAEIRVKSVLVDPALDIMIRGLNDTATKVKESFKTADGKEHTIERDKPLDPKVTIARANGETVAEGVMPFG